MLNKSPELKAERGYIEPDSFVRQDGSEVLVGEDWIKRKLELRDRCKGKCEAKYLIMGEPFAECDEDAADPHHIKPRSKGRDDRLSNLQALCRYHHNLLDKRKPRWGKHEQTIEKSTR